MIRRAVEVVREGGLTSLWFKILGETIYRRAVVLERPLEEPEAEVPPQGPVESSLLAEHEVAEYSNWRPDTPAAEVLRRLRAGHFCFVARHAGRIAHAVWVATECARIDYLGCEIRLAADEVYAYESFTAPHLRGQAIPRMRGTYMYRYLWNAGYRRSVAVLMPENRSGYKAAEKNGYHSIGVMGYVQLGPWRWSFCRLQPNARPLGVPSAPPSVGYWDGIARTRADRPHYLDTFLGTLKRQAHLALIERWGGIPGTGRVLKTDSFEEAMGPDALLPHLARAAGMAVGMDISAAIAQQAQGRDTESCVHYVGADVRRLPFANDAFALIVSPSTLDHFSDPRDLGRSLRELARILEPGGRLIVTLDNRQNIFDPLLRLVNRLGWTPYYLGRSYRVDELQGELEAAGFVVQETTAILHNPRLTAVAAVALAKKLRWSALTALIQHSLIAAQRLERTRWCYYTGSFVAAKAVRRT